MDLLVEIVTDPENEFLKMWDSCECFYTDLFPKSIFMENGGMVLFEQDWDGLKLWCRHYGVWHFFRDRMRMEDSQIKYMIAGALRRTQLKSFTLKPWHMDLDRTVLVERELRAGRMMRVTDFNISR